MAFGWIILINFLANTESWKSAESLGLWFSTQLEQSLDLIDRVHMHVLHSSGLISFLSSSFKSIVERIIPTSKYHLWLKCLHILFLA